MHTAIETHAPSEVPSIEPDFLQMAHPFYRQIWLDSQQPDATEAQDAHGPTHTPV